MRLPIILIAMLVVGLWSIETQYSMVRRAYSRYGILLNALLLIVSVLVLASAVGFQPGHTSGIRLGAVTAVFLIVATILLQIPWLIYNRLTTVAEPRESQSYDED